MSPRLIGESGSRKTHRTRKERQAHAARRRGVREVRSAPLTREDMYKDGRVPVQPSAGARDQYECSLCGKVKCNPVSYECKHSDCYACIRLHLEQDWKCPTCNAIITHKPAATSPRQLRLRSTFLSGPPKKKASQHTRGTV
ncbi:hypothetical protein C8R43DRAFT_1137266 [Mycena crocata]|nr:hypothetical protein C8R43DRAFT_1137266 [Mycena crocata]